MINEVKAWCRANLVVLIVSCIMIVAGVGILIVHSMTGFGGDSQLDTINVQIQDFQSKIEEQRLEQTKLESDLKSSVNGLNTTRVEEDTEAIESLLKKVCTWDNLSEYQKAYEDLTAQYPENEYKDFYSFFAPPAQGVRDDLNMKYVGLADGMPLVTRIDGGSYHYFMEVVFSSSYSKTADGTGRFLFTCSVDDEGVISDLFATRIS